MSVKTRICMCTVIFVMVNLIDFSLGFVADNIHVLRVKEVKSMGRSVSTRGYLVVQIQREQCLQ